MDAAFFCAKRSHNGEPYALLGKGWNFQNFGPE